MRVFACLFYFCFLFPSVTLAQPGGGAPDRSTHTSQLVTVEGETKLEVLDWGGEGRPLVLLAGKGFTAHAFDGFAEKLTSGYHVYGVTRRGYGASSAPVATDENYSAERLGRDVLAVMEHLKLQRPVVVGHSLAGEELSYLGTSAPDKVAGLVYLDAGYAYAFYDEAIGDLTIDYNTLRRGLERFTALQPMKDRKQMLQELTETLPHFEKELAPYRARMAGIPDTAPGPPDTQATRVDIAIFRGQQKFGGVRCPVLAIYADPHSFGDQFKGHPEALKAAQQKDQAETTAQADAFQRGNPQATVLRIADADHFVYRSNEAEVLGAMNRFLAGLAKP